MKKCTQCSELKPLDQFYKRSGRKGLFAECKTCMTQRVTNAVRAKKKRAIAYLGGVCEGCGNTYHPAVFQFHHRDPSEKEVSWKQLQKRSWDKVVLELDKCALLCANCHQLEHAGLEGW